MSTEADPSKPAKPKSDWQQLTHSRHGILLTLFLVTAALGLPLLFISPVFSRTEKWLWSIIVIVYTIVLVTVTIWVAIWCWGVLMEYRPWEWISV